MLVTEAHANEKLINMIDRRKSMVQKSKGFIKNIYDLWNNMWVLLQTLT